MICVLRSDEGQAVREGRVKEMMCKHCVVPTRVNLNTILEPEPCCVVMPVLRNQTDVRRRKKGLNREPDLPFLNEPIMTLPLGAEVNANTHVIRRRKANACCLTRHCFNVIGNGRVECVHPP